MATLTIGSRSGSFPGMLEEREIRVVVVSDATLFGHTPTPEIAESVRYTGEEITVSSR